VQFFEDYGNDGEGEESKRETFPAFDGREEFTLRPHSAVLSSRVHDTHRIMRPRLAGEETRRRHGRKTRGRYGGDKEEIRKMTPYVSAHILIWLMHVLQHTGTPTGRYITHATAHPTAAHATTPQHTHTRQI
jgi:hypothetical protein